MNTNYFLFQTYTCLGEIVVLPKKDKNSMVYTSLDIREMPDDELDEHISSAADRWTWDTDRRILDLLEKERKRRNELGYRVERVKTSQGISTIRRVPIE